MTTRLRIDAGSAVWIPALVGLACAIVAGLVTAATTPSDVRSVLVLTVVGLLMFVAGSVRGHGRTVGAATVPMLASAMVAIGLADESNWLGAAAIGVLWFVAVELAWESIDRRIEDVRTPAVTGRRVQEVATILMLALGVAMLGGLVSELAPHRTLLIQAGVFVLLGSGIAAASRRLKTIGE